MRTLMVLRDSSGFPPDVRVQKEARTLISEGVKVSLLCCLKEGQPEQECVEGIDVRRITLPQSYTKGLDYWLIRAGVSSWEHPYWAWAIEKAARAVGADVLHIHDLPLVQTAIRIGKELHIPVVADLHEFYPEAIRVHYGWKGEAICAIGRWEKRERQALHQSDTAFTISPQGLSYYQRKYGIDGRVKVIGNYVDLQRFDSLPIDESIGGRFAGRPTIAYLGSYGKHRGIEVLVKAMTTIVEEVPYARLVLVGNMPDNLQGLVSAKTWQHVQCEGFVADILFPSYMKAADVLVLPFIINSPQTNYCCPHKIFEYMAARKPIVASHGESLLEYVGKANAGVLVASGDHVSLGLAITRLLQDKAGAQTLGDNGRRAVETRFNWANEGKKLVEVYWTL